MPIIAENKPSKVFELPKQGTVHAVLAEVRDMGLIDQTWKGVTKKVHKVLFRWQLAEMDAEKPPQPKRLYERFTNSLDPKANLYDRIQEMFGKTPPMSLDLEKIVGTNVDLVVVHKEKEGKTYANIAAVIRRAQDAPKLAIVPIPLTKTDMAAAEKSGARPVTEEDPIDDSSIPF